MKFWLLLLAGLIGYYIYQNAKVNPQVTRIDGWEQTARDRRPNMPSPAVGEVPPTFDGGERVQPRAN